MKNNLIISISNDSMCACIGNKYKEKVNIIDYRIRKYDNFLVNENNVFDFNFLYKELSSILGDFNKKTYSNENVIVILPDNNVECYFSSTTSSPFSGAVSQSDILSLFNRAGKMHIGNEKIKDKEVFKIVPTSFTADDNQFSRPPIGESCINLTMNYALYFINKAIFRSLSKVIKKCLGHESFKFVLNSICLADFIKLNNISSSNYFIVDSNYKYSTLSIAANNIVCYSLKLTSNYFSLLDQLVHEYDVAYSDIKYILHTYGYDKIEHPMKVLLYEDENNHGLKVSIYQSDINTRIDAFIDKFISELHSSSTTLKNFIGAASYELPYVIVGELFNIPGFKERFIEKLNKTISTISNKTIYCEEKLLISCVSAIYKIDEYDFSKIQEFDEVSNVKRGE